MSAQVVHRPGPFKQSNKRHKLESGKPKKNNKGKCDVKSLTILHKKHDLNRIERKNQLSQLRKAKREEALKSKRRLGVTLTPPIVVVVMSMNDATNPDMFLNDLKSCDDGLTINYSSLGNCHMNSSRLKQRFTFLIPDKNNLHSVLDAVKVSEMLLFLHSTDVPDEETDRLLSIIMAHALPTTIHAVQGLSNLNPKKKAESRKHILKNMELRFPGEKIHQADTRTELQLLLRQIGNQKHRSVKFRDARFHMLGEESALIDVDAEGKGVLKVSGYIRGQPLNVNGLVHLPGLGTFQMQKIVTSAGPYEDVKRNNVLQWAMTDEPDATKQESLQSEVVPDAMEGEQTWPTQDELEAAEIQPKKIVRKAPLGTSDYQASWIIESEDENDESDSEGSDKDDAGEADPNNENMSEGDDEEAAEMDTDMTETGSISNKNDENYDKTLDMNEEKQALVRFKEERLNQMFPDEQDTPFDVSARIRYQRYRGLKNFRSSPWDPMENLPLDYARIYRFQNFRQTKKKVLNAEKTDVLTDIYATLFIKDVPQSLYDTVQNNSTLVIYGLLPHEQKMSVLNTVIRKHPTCKTPVKSKDTLIFHVGYTRFTVNPIFSEHRTGNKFKYERYLPAETAVVASFYAPVMFPPASVVVFRKQKDGSHELVATGSVLDVNPNRVVVKRIVLSGWIAKINKRMSVIKYMFFNKEDINWFKCVELYTKCGRRGHIRESLGTHGHMKCIFDDQLQSQDVVLMSLYKRVFPKWTYQLYNPESDDSAAPRTSPIMEV